MRPLGFSLDESQVRRAGLDYWPHLDLAVYANWEEFLARARPDTLVFASTKGTRNVYSVQFSDGDFVVFGNESGGLPSALYDAWRERLFSIPMGGKGARSLNLANAVAVVLFEALRQINGWN